MNLTFSLKALALSALPDRTLQAMKKIHYARTLRSLSERDVLDFKIIKHLIHPGDFVVDIGANVGIYTKYLSSLVGGQGRVYSIEPVPLTFEILSSNVKKLGLKNVVPIHCAISDGEGTATMEVPLYQGGGENFYEARISSNNTHGSLRRVKVATKTIDSLFSNLSPGVSFIKCDVEGHELPCVRGSVNIIRRQKPAWFIEISGDPDDPGSAACKTFELLGGEGYEVWWFDGTALKRRSKGDRSVNYYFLTGQHLELLRKRGLLTSDGGHG